MKNEVIKKYLVIILILINLFYLSFSLFKSFSIASSPRVGISTDIVGIDEKLYPGYKKAIQELQSKPEYSNWTFKLYYTGLDWKEVIVSESQGHFGSPKSLFQRGNTYNGEWFCPICGKQEYDNGSWSCASEEAVSYVMDPRSSIKASDIFQFQYLGYDETITTEDIKKMVSRHIFRSRKYN